MSSASADNALSVAVFGGSAFGNDHAIWQASYELGQACAREGWVVVNGGYGGVMEACSRGACEAGGRVMGVSCSIFSSAPNEFLTQTMPSDDLYERLRLLIDNAEAYVCMPGSTGTLAELAMVWELMNKRLIPVRPLLCWGDFWRPVVAIFDQDPNKDPRVPALANLKERRGELITFVNSVAETIEALKRGVPAE